MKIITHPNFEYMWEELSQTKEYEQVKVQFEFFNDGWPNFFIDNVKENIEGQNVIYIGDFSTPEKVFENYAIIRWILDNNVRGIEIIMPYFPVWTMERVNQKWEVATASYYADIFSSIPSGTHIKTKIHIFDIHALSERFFFNSNKINLDLHTAMLLIKWKIKTNVIIVFPDEWAKKRFQYGFEWYETIFCIKRRVWNTREIILAEWNPQWKECIIIDDLIQSGGTIIETAKLLKKLWCKSVSAFATHWIFPKESYKKICNAVDRLYVTDTIPQNKVYATEANNMEVLGIEELLKEVI